MLELDAVVAEVETEEVAVEVREGTTVQPELSPSGGVPSRLRLEEE